MYHRTNGGTYIIYGIEYNTYPPPLVLIKVIDRCWAKEFITNGSMRFRYIEYYKQIENEALRDPNEGHGIWGFDDHFFHAGSANTVYIWCATRQCISASKILELAGEERDCFICVHKPKILMQRVNSALHQQELTLQCGNIVYNKGQLVNKKTFNKQPFHANIFQKDTGFCKEHEYRLAITDVSRFGHRQPVTHQVGINGIHISILDKKYIDIKIGCCANIATIENLPTSSARFQSTLFKSCHVTRLPQGLVTDTTLTNTTHP